MVGAVTLEEKASKIVKAVKDCGKNWASRRDIAEQLGKTKLSGADVVRLEMLVKDGFIDVEQQTPTKGNIPVMRVYRVKL